MKKTIVNTTLPKDRIEPEPEKIAAKNVLEPVSGNGDQNKHIIMLHGWNSNSDSLQYWQKK